jgi:hypothetical protein
MCMVWRIIESLYPYSPLLGKVNALDLRKRGGERPTVNPLAASPGALASSREK